jgi:hypothetical protein
MREHGCLSDEAEQEPREERGPSEAADGPWPGLGGVAAGLAGAGVLVTGGALLIGWMYTKAFYDRLGVPMRALDLQAIDYLTAKVEIWYALAAGMLGALISLLMWRYDFGLAVPERFALWVRGVATLASLAAAYAGALGVVATGNVAFLYAFATGATFAPVFLWNFLAASARWRPLSAGVPVILVIFIALAFLPPVAAGLGCHDAEALLEGPEEGSGARFVAAEPLGLPGERYESDVYVTESVGVVRATDNAYFVVVRGTKIVYSLPVTRVLRVEYTPD